MQEIEKLKAIRKVLPIPLLEAKKLLMDNKGEVLVAVLRWKESILTRLVEGTGIDLDQGLAILEKHQYDFQKAYVEAYRVTHDLIELTLNSTGDLWTKLYRVARVFQHQYQITEYLMYSPSALQELPEYARSFYMIWIWINYIQLNSSAALRNTPEEILINLQKLSLDRHVNLIRKLQANEVDLAAIKREFIVESEFGEALVRWLKDKTIKTA